MSLEIYKRNQTWWFKGRIDELPSSEYYRQSTYTSSEAGARAFINNFQRQELKTFYSGKEQILTFVDAVLIYKANQEYAKALRKVIDEIGNMPINEITPIFVRSLGSKLQPMNSTGTWRKSIVSPIRAVINNAHDHGLCGHIMIKDYSELECVRQDKFRGKQSRIEKKAANWDWIIAFRTAAPPNLAALALFMFETAARIGQATAIKFLDLDIKNNRVYMPAAKGTAAQWVSLSEELTLELSELKPRYTRRRSGQKVLSDRLFGYLKRDGIYKIWKRICRDAEIEQIMPHAAGRHAFATEAIVRQGIDPVTVSKVGRWADPNLVLKTYAHAENEDEIIKDAFRTGRVQAETRNNIKDMKSNDKSKNNN
jgi:integrase